MSTRWRSQISWATGNTSRSENLADNPQAQLFLIDYAARQRVKIWGEAWDSNCPQHIPRRFEEADVKRLLAERDSRIEELEAALEMLKSARGADG